MLAQVIFPQPMDSTLNCNNADSEASNFVRHNIGCTNESTCCHARTGSAAFVNKQQEQQIRTEYEFIIA
jgi:hypothetical protein